MKFWAGEAGKRALQRRQELCNAAILPNAKPADIRSFMDSMKWMIYEADHEDEIAEQERQMAERIAKGTHKAPRRKKVVTNG